MAPKRLPDDFREFIDSLNSNDVCYLLVGGWAVGLYGHPRATKDIDFLVATDDDNLAKLMQALAAFGAPHVDPARFKEPGSVFRMGVPPIQIDVIGHATGIDIAECWPRRTIVVLQGSQVCVIAKEDLISNKLASGRTQDKADAEALVELREP